MSSRNSRSQPIRVFARWRPMPKENEDHLEMRHSTSQNSNSLYTISIKKRPEKPKNNASIPLPKKLPDKNYSTGAVLESVFGPSDNNEALFSTIVAPTLSKVLQGAKCSFFAYGHSGSGKTHTLIGYQNEDNKNLGLCLAGARSIFDELEILNKTQTEHGKLGIALSIFEVRQKYAYDLLNNRTQCSIREGAGGKVHIRGPTEVLEDGKVRIQPIVQHACWTFESLGEKLNESIGLRQVGTSSIHDQSSRTHAVLELEIITADLMSARDTVIDRQSEAVAVGKAADELLIAEFGIAPSPALTNALLAKAKFEEKSNPVTEAEAKVAAIMFADGRPACLGGKLVFVDLAGAEYQNKIESIEKQSLQNQQEGRQINTDLLSLKEVIRACSTNQARIPFRSSPLTMALRELFLGASEGLTTMIATISLEEEQYYATLNTLRYVGLVRS